MIDLKVLRAIKYKVPPYQSSATTQQFPRRQGNLLASNEQTNSREENTYFSLPETRLLHQLWEQTFDVAANDASNVVW